MKLIWTEPALADRDHIVRYIATDNRNAAIKIDTLMDETAESLFHAPQKGRLGRVEGTRELIMHRNYILVYGYDIENTTIYIVAVLHSAQQWPPL